MMPQQWGIDVMNFVDSVGVPGEGYVEQVIVGDEDGESEPELEPEGMPAEVDVEGVSDEPDPPWDETVFLTAWGSRRLTGPHGMPGAQRTGKYGGWCVMVRIGWQGIRRSHRRAAGWENGGCILNAACPSRGL